MFAANTFRCPPPTDKMLNSAILKLVLQLGLVDLIGRFLVGVLRASDLRGREAGGTFMHGRRALARDRSGMRMRQRDGGGMVREGQM